MPIARTAVTWSMSAAGSSLRQERCSCCDWCAISCRGTALAAFTVLQVADGPLHDFIGWKAEGEEGLGRGAVPTCHLNVTGKSNEILCCLAIRLLQSQQPGSLTRLAGRRPGAYSCTYRGRTSIKRYPANVFRFNQRRITFQHPPTPLHQAQQQHVRKEEEWVSEPSRCFVLRLRTLMATPRKLP
jgi:hypothetical protein